MRIARPEVQQSTRLRKDRGARSRLSTDPTPRISRPNATLSTTVSHGKTPCSWKTGRWGARCSSQGLEADASRRGAQQSRQQLEQGGLAAPARAHDAHDLGPPPLRTTLRRARRCGRPSWRMYSPRPRMRSGSSIGRPARFHGPRLGQKRGSMYSAGSSTLSMRPFSKPQRWNSCSGAVSIEPVARTVGQQARPSSSALS